MKEQGTYAGTFALYLSMSQSTGASCSRYYYLEKRDKFEKMKQNERKWRTKRTIKGSMEARSKMKERKANESEGETNMEATNSQKPSFCSRAWRIVPRLTLDSSFLAIMSTIFDRSCQVPPTFTYMNDKLQLALELPWWETKRERFPHQATK